MPSLRELDAGLCRRKRAVTHAPRAPQQLGDETRPRPRRPATDGSQMPRREPLYSLAGTGGRRPLAHDRLDSSGGYEDAAVAQADCWDLAAADELVRETARDAQ